MTKNKIQGKIILLICVFSFVLVSLLWCLQIFGINTIYLYNQKIRLNRTSAYIDKCIRSETIDDKMLSLLSENNIAAVLYDQDGKTLLYSDSNQNMNYYDLIPLIREAEQNRSLNSFSLIQSNELSIPQLDYQNHVYSLEDARIVMHNRLNMVHIIKSENTYVLSLSISAEPAEETVLLLRVQLFAFTVMVVLLSLFLCFYLSRKIIKPITEISRNADELKYGKYVPIARKHTFFEIKELDNTLLNAAYDLSKTEQYRKELMGNVSHDLRTPLTLIRGYAELIHDFPDDKNNTDNAELIINESERLTRLVNDILEVSKNENLSMVLNIETFDLNVCIKDVLSRYASIRDLKTEISFHSDSEETIVSADKDRITQVLYNLINNAIDYTNNHKVDVYLKKESDIVRISIVDYGDGIKEEEIQKIWDRYYKLDTVHKRSQVSTGIGLSIVKEILEKHSAKFGVKSVLGAGSCFWFELPVQYN